MENQEKNLTPYEQTEARLIDLIARTLILVARGFSAQNIETKKRGGNNKNEHGKRKKTI